MDILMTILPIITFIIGFNFGIRVEAKPITISRVIKDTTEEVKEIVKPITPKGIKESKESKRVQEEYDELNRILREVENYDGSGKFN